MFSIFWPFKLVGFLTSFLLNTLVLATCLLTMASFLGEKGWLWDLASHFRMHYLVIQVIALAASIAALKLKKRSRFEVLGTVVFLGLFIGLNLTQIAPYYFPAVQPDESRIQAKVKILHINMLDRNRRAEPVIDLIREKNPDMLSLAEYTGWWKQTLKSSGVLKAYPYKYVLSFGNDGFYSKIPFKHATVTYTQKKAVDPTTIVRMRLANQPVTIFMVHPRSPLTPDWIRRSEKQYEYWMNARQNYDSNFILLGDLNRTQWSLLFRKLLFKTQLRDSQMGFGVQPTWPSVVPYSIHEIRAEKPQFPAWLGIPIDHVLISEKFVVLNRQTGPFVGSDHLPVYIELGLGK